MKIFKKWICRFVTHEMLSRRNYIKEDTLFLKIKADPKKGVCVWAAINNYIKENTFFLKIKTDPKKELCVWGSMCTLFLMVTSSLVLWLTNIQKLGGGGGANLAQKYFFLFLPFLYLFDLKDWAGEGS